MRGPQLNKFLKTLWCSSGFLDALLSEVVDSDSAGELLEVRAIHLIMIAALFEIIYKPARSFCSSHFDYSYVCLSLTE